MKKALAIFITSLIGLLLIPKAFAQTVTVAVCPEDGLFAQLCKLNASGLGTTIGRVITILLIVAVVISVIFLIWGGIRWITSGGDKGKVDSARGTIVAAIVGLILAFLAFFIVNVVFQVVLGQPLSNLSLPSLTGTGAGGGGGRSGGGTARAYNPTTDCNNNADFKLCTCSGLVSSSGVTYLQTVDTSTNPSTCVWQQQ